MKFQTKIDLKWKGDEIKVKGKKYIGKSVLEAAVIIQNQAVNLCAVDFGRLRGSIFVKTKEVSIGNADSGKALPSDIIDAPNEDDVAFIGTNCEYAADVEFNTKAHKITVKNAVVLSDGKTFFGKSVNHPGTQGQPFLRPSFDLSQGKILTIITQNGKQIFKDYLK